MAEVVVVRCLKIHTMRIQWAEVVLVLVACSLSLRLLEELEWDFQWTIEGPNPLHHRREM